MLGPRGSMRWDTDGQGLLPLQLAPEPPPDPGCKSREGQEPAQDPGAASQDLAEPRAAPDLATADEHRRRERKHCQVVRKTLSSTPVSTPSFSHTYQSLRIRGTSLNPIQDIFFFLKKRKILVFA